MASDTKPKVAASSAASTSQLGLDLDTAAASTAGTDPAAPSSASPKSVASADGDAGAGGLDDADAAAIAAALLSSPDEPRKSKRLRPLSTDDGNTARAARTRRSLKEDSDDDEEEGNGKADASTGSSDSALKKTAAAAGQPSSKANAKAAKAVSKDGNGSKTAKVDSKDAHSAKDATDTVEAVDDDAEEEEEEEEEGEEGDQAEDDEDETMCDICGDDYSPPKNRIVLCDGKDCDIPLHQKCYGIETVPPGDEKWFCQRCEDGVPVASTNVICCPITTGALKRTRTPKAYIHSLCALWNAAIDDDKESINVEKWLLDKEKCYICNQSKGLTVACMVGNCKRWFHVMCGVNEGLIIRQPARKIASAQLLCADHKSQPKSRNSVPTIKRPTASSASSETPPSSQAKRGPLKRKRKDQSDDEADDTWTHPEGDNGAGDDTDAVSATSASAADEDGDEPMPAATSASGKSDSRLPTPTGRAPGSAGIARAANATSGASSADGRKKPNGSSGPASAKMSAAGKASLGVGSSGSNGNNNNNNGASATVSASSSSSSTTAARPFQRPTLSSVPDVRRPEPGNLARKPGSTAVASASSSSNVPVESLASGKFTSSRQPPSSNQAIKMSSAHKPWLKDSSRASLNDDSSPLNASANKPLRSTPGAASGSATPTSAWSWLMDKMSAIKAVSNEIENMPAEFKRLLARDIGATPATGPSAGFPGSSAQSAPGGPTSGTATPPTTALGSAANTATSSSSLLDTLLDNSYNDFSKIERENEARMLRQQLQSAQAEIQRMGQENSRLKLQLQQQSQAALAQTENAGSAADLAALQQQYQTLQDNLDAVFSFLNLPQMPYTPKSDVEAYTGVLRSIIDRARAAGYNGGGNGGGNNGGRAGPPSKDGLVKMDSVGDVPLRKAG
ncbi:hypothetical protein BC831DRAFT_470819 [Entophlyctis helioformis]|nr:hypothetical protein BC831DRAFT_470819 [Entophlyctis helioformis]